MRSELFRSGDHIAVQRQVMDLINESTELLSRSTSQSPRAAGDAMEDVVARSLELILGDHCVEYHSGFARRAMADVAFRDAAGLYYAVDVKTHRAGTHFNMPNLTSVERLARFYEDDSNFFCLLIISYSVQGMTPRVSDVTFVPIEFISWDCLTIGALGWGQIQIANSNVLIVVPGYSRKQWMLDFSTRMLNFYPREISKIGKRISRFEQVNAFWRGRLED